MPEKDKQGREYALLSKITSGSKLQVDADFTCIKPHSIVEVYEADAEYYVLCDEGTHKLDDHIAASDEDSLIGFYPAPTA